jgi:hypothetical protein
MIAIKMNVALGGLLPHLSRLNFEHAAFFMRNDQLPLRNMHFATT